MGAAFCHNFEVVVKGAVVTASKKHGTNLNNLKSRHRSGILLLIRSPRFCLSGSLWQPNTTSFENSERTVNIDSENTECCEFRVNRVTLSSG